MKEKSTNHGTEQRDLACAVAKRNRWNKSRWRRYAEWRIRALARAYYGKCTLAASLGIVSVQLLMALTMILGNMTPILGFFILGFFELFFRTSWTFEQSDGNYGKAALAASWTLLQYLVLPVMPILRITDLLLVSMGEQDLDRFAARPMRKLTQGCDNGIPPDVVADYYARRIEQARETLLGERSDLRATEADLRKCIERKNAHIERLEERVRQAVDDARRRAPLRLALDTAIEQRARIMTALWRIENVISRANAILDESKQPLTDTLLIAEVESDTDGDVAAIKIAQQVVERHTIVIRSTILHLTAAITSPSLALPSGEDTDLDDYFLRLDRVAETVNAI